MTAAAPDTDLVALVADLADLTGRPTHAETTAIAAAWFGVPEPSPSQVTRVADLLLELGMVCRGARDRWTALHPHLAPRGQR